MYHQHKWIETSPSKFVSFVISYHQVRQNNEQTVTNSTSSLVRYNTIHVHLYIVHGKVTALTNRKFSRTYVTTTLDLSTLTDFVKLAPQSEGVKTDVLPKWLWAMRVTRNEFKPFEDGASSFTLWCQNIWWKRYTPFIFERNIMIFVHIIQYAITWRKTHQTKIQRAHSHL